MPLTDYGGQRLIGLPSALISSEPITLGQLSASALSLLGSYTNGQLLIGNGTNLTAATLTGTASQITVTNGAGSITLATPQDIATSSSPSFQALTVSTGDIGIDNTSNYTAKDSGGTAQSILKIDASDVVQIGSSSYTSALRSSSYVALLGGQLQFPATQNTSADANTLDDYEEGTWTPVIIGTTSAGAGTYTSQYGTYVKIGRVVIVWCTVSWTAHTGTGNMRISGLPFTVSSAGAGDVHIMGVSSITYSASTVPAGIPINSSDQIQLIEIPVGGGTNASITLDTSGAITIGATYRAT